MGTLKQLPIWPVLSGPFRSAAELKLAPHTSLTLTTMIDQTTFLRIDLASRYKDVLNRLGVPQLSYQDFLNDEVGLARGYLPAENIGVYQRFTETIHKVNPTYFNPATWVWTEITAFVCQVPSTTLLYNYSKQRSETNRTQDSCTQN